LQSICIAERTALLSGRRDIDFIMNIADPWTGVRWGELLAFEASEDDDSPLQLRDNGISTYAVDWQLREIGGVVAKSPPKDGSYRVLDLPPFLADLLRWARDNRRKTCSCPIIDGRPTCKGDDPTPPDYLFLCPGGGHPRRSNYADRFITPAAEGLYPTRKGIRRPVYVATEPWPGIPITKGNRKVRAVDLAEGTWPDLAGKLHPHDYRHTHSTWLHHRRAQGPPDGAPRPRHARHGRRLQPRHPGHAPAPLRRARITVEASCGRATPAKPALIRRPVGPNS
jgi:integrase